MGEMKVFFGILIYMGLYRVSSQEEYWECNSTLPKHPIAQAMPLVRYQQIKRFLHVCDPLGDNGATFFFNKLEPLLSHVRATSKQLWFPQYRVAVDEMMILCNGRSYETVRMKNKPIGAGYKIWALCDRGYVYEYFPHSNKQPWKELENYKGTLTRHSAVVVRLVESLPRESGKKILRYAVFMDNLFSSIKLFSMMRDKGIGCVGTTRANSAGFPKQLKVRGREHKHLEWDTIGSVVVDKVNCVAWVDNNAVLMLTTIHQVGNDHTVKRLRRRPRETSTNGRKVREVFGENATKVLPIPVLIDDYNRYMGSVDIADQLHATYSTHIRAQRT